MGGADGGDRPHPQGDVLTDAAMVLFWRAIGVVRGLWRREQADRELDAELRDFLDRAADERVASGSTPAEAARTARAAFGSVEAVKERVREVSFETFVEGVRQDLHYAFRSLRRSPAFTAVAVLTLAVGIGANTAFFSIVNAVLLRSLPFPDADRLVAILTIGPTGGGPAVSPAKLNAWRRETALFDGLAAYQFSSANVAGPSVRAFVSSANVNSDFFPLFGARTVLGRLFDASEDRPGTVPVVVLSHGFWQQQFGGAADAVGKILTINGRGHTVLGVLAPSFQIADVTAAAPDLWIPLGIDPASESHAAYFFAAAHLRAGVSREQVNARLAIVAEDFKKRFPTAIRATMTFGVLSLRGLIVRDVQRSLLVLYGAVITVLLIACVNIGSLNLVRMTGRQGEIAIRAALGASQRRIVRQLLTEGVVLSLAGGLAGLALGTILLPRLSGLVAGLLPRLSSDLAAQVDWRVLVVTTFTCVAASIVLGLVPALHAGRKPLNPASAGSRSGTDGRRTLRARTGLVVAEVALAVVLLVAAVLLVRTFAALRTVDPGFDAANLLSLRTTLSEPGLTTAARVAAIIDSGIGRMRTEAGVTTAAASLCCLPLENQGYLPFIVPGRPLDGPYHDVGTWWSVTPDYFDALGIRILKGRAFTDADRLDAEPVVIVNQTMARRFWPDADPLGQQLLLGQNYLPGTVTPRRIVGIVGDVRDILLSRTPASTTYIPMRQLDDAQVALVVKAAPVVWIARTAGEPRRFERALAHELEAVTGYPVARIRTMDEIVSASTARSDLNTVLMSGFGLAALLLAAIGIYGVSAYAVEQRAREFGIRRALGATPLQLRGLVLRQGAVVTAVGLMLGIIGALAITRVLSSLLYDVAPRDPSVFVSAAAVLAVVALAAAWLPAGRALRQEINAVLRHE